MDVPSIAYCEPPPGCVSSISHFWVHTGDSGIVGSHPHALQTQKTSLSLDSALFFEVQDHFFSSHEFPPL